MNKLKKQIAWEVQAIQKALTKSRLADGDTNFETN